MYVNELSVRQAGSGQPSEPVHYRSGPLFGRSNLKYVAGVAEWPSGVADLVLVARGDVARGGLALDSSTRM